MANGPNIAALELVDSSGPNLANLELVGSGPGPNLAALELVPEAVPDTSEQDALNFRHSMQPEQVGARMMGVPSPVMDDAGILHGKRSLGASGYFGERSMPGEVFAALAKGTLGVDESLYRAARTLGLDTSELIEGVVGSQAGWEPSRRGEVWRSINEGITSTVQSVGAGVPGMLAGAFSSGPMGAAAGYAASAGTIFALAEYDKFMEEAETLGISREAVQDKAIISAIAEGGFEAASDLIGAKIFGLLGGNTLKQPAKQGLLNLAKRYFGNTLKLGAVEIPSEMATAAVQAHERQEAGIPSPDPMEAAKQAVGPTAVQTMLMGGVGMGAQRLAREDSAVSIEADQAEPTGPTGPLELVEDERVLAEGEEIRLQVAEENLNQRAQPPSGEPFSEQEAPISAQPIPQQPNIENLVLEERKRPDYVPRETAPEAMAPEPTTIYTPKNEPLQVRYGVVDVRDLKLSHDLDGKESSDYSGDLQPRDRKKKSSRIQVEEIKNAMVVKEPITLGATIDTDKGGPVVDPATNEVLAANGRGNAIKLAYASGEADAYRQMVRAEAQKVGVDPAVVDGIEQPVLVRFVEGQITDRPEVARRLNESAGQRMSPAEVAKVDASRMTDQDIELLALDESGNLLAASNREFVRRFMSHMSSQERAELMDDDLRPNQRAVDRMTAAIFAKAYGSDRLIRLQSQAVDPGIRNILSALVSASPRFAQAKAIKHMGGDADFIGRLVDGVEFVLSAKDKGLSVDEHIRQMGFFKEAPVEVKALASFMDVNKRSAKRMSEGFVSIASQISRELEHQATQDMFGRELSAPDDIIVRALSNVEAELGQPKRSTQGTLYGSDQADLEQDRGSGEPDPDGRTAVGDAADGGGAVGPGQQRAQGRLDQGPFGPVFTQFQNKPKEAIEHLTSVGGGEAVGAFTHPEVGPIDFVWGKPGNPEKEYKNGYGLAHIIAKHGIETANRLPSILKRARTIERPENRNRIILRDEPYEAVISLDYYQKKKTWVLTAYELYKSEPPNPGRTIDLAGRSDGPTPPSRKGTNNKIATGKPGVNAPDDDSEFTVDFLGAGTLDKALKKLLGSKKPDNLAVAGKKEKRLGLGRALLSNPSQLAKKYPRLNFYVVHAKDAMKRQDRLRKKFTDRLDGAIKELNEDQRKDLADLLLQGDAEGKEYTSTEVRAQGFDQAVATAYAELRQLHQASWRLLSLHRFRFGKQTGYRAGHVPHIFREWNIYEVVKDEEGNPTTGRILSTHRSLAEANKAGERHAELNPDADFMIKPLAFQWPADLAAKAIMKDGQYFRNLSTLVKSLEVDKEQAKALLDITNRRQTRHRYWGHVAQRKGQTGFETKNLFELLRNHYAGLSRYVAMDEFKSKGIPKFQQDFGVLLDQARMDNTEAWYVQHYINDVLGVPGAIESFLNSSLHSVPWLKNHLRSSRPSIWIASNLLQVSGILKLGLGNISSALVNLTDLMKVHAKFTEKQFARGIKRAMRPSSSEKRILKQMGVDIQIGLTETGSYSVSQRLGNWGQWSMINFLLAETFNRRVAGLTAYYVGRDKKMTHAQAIRYGKKIIDETQFDYSVADTSFIFRNPAGRVAGQFKPWGIKTFEYLTGIRGKEMAKFAGTFVLMSGLFGWPFAESMGLLIEWLFGVNPLIEAKKAIIKWAGEHPAKKVVAEVALYGATSQIGIDVSQRIGLQDLVPTRFRDYLGPTANTFLQALGVAERADNIEVVRTFSPAVGNYARAVETVMDDMEVRDPYKKGRLRYKATPAEVIARALGFRPLREAKISTIVEITRHDERYLEKHYAKGRRMLIRGLRENNPEEVYEAFEYMQEHGVVPIKSTIREDMKLHDMPEQHRLMRRTRKQQRPELAELYKFMEE